MANKQLLLQLLCIIILSALSSRINAQTANITQACAPISIDFTGPGGQMDYYWDFDDAGTSSNLQNPAHNFVNPGEYNVQLFEGESGALIGTVTINVFEKPNLDFIGDPTIGCSPLSVDFSDNTVYENGISVTSYAWTFGDGGNSMADAPSYTYNDSGMFSVGLAITTNTENCDTTVIKTNYIEVGEELEADFDFTPGFSCTAPLTVSFTNSSASGQGISYAWDFGNGETSTQFDPADVTYTTEGEFIVELVVTSDAAGCSNTVRKRVTISKPSINLQMRDTLCLNAPNFIGSGTNNARYSWDFGPDAQPMTSTNQSQNVSFNRPGIHTISFTISDADMTCMSDTSFQVFVQEVDLSFTKDPEQHCEYPATTTYTGTSNNGTSYRWTFDNMTIQQGQEVTHTRNSPDTSEYHQVGLYDRYFNTLFVSTTAGCFVDTSWQDTVWAPYGALLVDDHDGCAPHDVNFDYNTSSRENITSYTVHFGDGQSQNLTAPTPISHSYTMPGEYLAFLIIETSAGCIDTSARVLIEVGEALSVDFSADRTDICVGDSVQLQDLTNDQRIDGWFYSYGDHSEQNCFDNPNPMYGFTNSIGPQDIKLTVDYNGCFSEIIKQDFITVRGAIADFEYDVDCDSFEIIKIKNTTQNGENFFWSVPTPNDTLFDLNAGGIRGPVSIRLFASSENCPATIKEHTVFITEPEAVIDVFDNEGRQLMTPYQLCGNEGYLFSAANSQDVVEACGKGYEWHFSEDTEILPRRTSQPDLLELVPLRGDFEVRLEVTDVNGCTDWDTLNFKTYGQDVSFTFSDTIVCLPAELELISTSTSDTTIALYEFYTNDGAYYTDSAVVHNYTGAIDGVDSVNATLIVTDVIGCKDTFMNFAQLYRPSSSLSFDRARKVCVFDSILISATDFTDQGSFLNYDWYIQDSVGTRSTQQSFQVGFPSEGKYPLTLIIEEDATGCVDTITETIEVQNYPIAGFSTNQDTSAVLCNPASVLFTDTTVFSAFLIYDWFINGELESEIADPGFTFEKGTYDVFLIAKSLNDCIDTSITRTFEVIGPEGRLLTDSMTICKGESVEFEFTDTVDVSRFQWDFGDGVVESDVNPVTHQYNFNPPNGRTTARVTFFGPSGVCTKTEEVPINIHEVFADFERNRGRDTAICQDRNYNFLSLSTNADNLSWDLGDGAMATGDTVNHVYEMDGFYDVTLSVTSDSLSCVDTITKRVQIYPLPIPSGIGDTICMGDTATLMATNLLPNSFYQWSLDSSILTTTGIEITAIPDMTRTYRLIEEDSLGCRGSVNIQVDVITPLAPSVWDTSIVIGDTAFLPLPQIPFLTYTWNPMTGLSCFDCPDPFIQIFQDESYVLTVGDILECFETQYTFNISVIEEEKLRVPDLFTPNGDNANDIIYAEGWAIKELVSFRIFNRYGEKIFETNDINQGWDGTHKGENQVPGMYWYQVEAISWKNDNMLTQEGEFELAR